LDPTLRSTPKMSLTSVRGDVYSVRDLPQESHHLPGEICGKERKRLLDALFCRAIASDVLEGVLANDALSIGRSWARIKIIVDKIERKV